MNKEDLLFIDIETCSAVSIKNVLDYVNHPSTRLLCAAARYNDIMTVWDTTRPCPYPTDKIWVAHNAYGFDKLIWNRFFPNHKPLKWLDTMPMCRAVGLPGKLEKVTMELFGEKKEDIGDILSAMCPKRIGNNWVYPQGNEVIWRKLISYNVKDVELLEKIWNVVSPHFNEYELLEVDQIINERGIKFDKKFALQQLRLWDVIQKKSFDYISEITKGELTDTDLRSTVKVNWWLMKQGVNLYTLNKQFVTEELEEYENNGCESLPLILEVLRAREVVTRGAKGKIERLLDIAMHLPPSESRLKHSTVAYGAHTGRWSGRGFQPHNMPRTTGIERTKKILALYDEQGFLQSKDLGEEPDNALVDLVRPILCAEEGKILLKADYAQVEARCTAWLANRTFPDRAYEIMASKIFGIRINDVTQTQRQVGKVAELSCQYGVSGTTFGITCRKQKIKLEEIGLTGKEVVTAYRESHPEIVEFWRDIENMAKGAVLSNDLYRTTKIKLQRIGKHLHIILPSGRPIVYRNARIENRIPKYCALLGIEPHYKPTIIYDHPHGREGILYGGLITENIAQAICRDILAYHLTICEKAEFPVVLHVHDEIICEVEEYKDNLENILKLNMPDWAKTFPMKLEVSANKRYIK